MRLSNLELRKIVERASTLTERLSGDFTPVPGDLTIATRRLALWKHLSPTNTALRCESEDSLHRPAATFEADLVPLLGVVKSRTDRPLPAWAPFVGELVENLSRHFEAFDPSQGSKLLTARRPALPFEALYQGIATIAWEQILALHPAALTVCEPAKHGLQSYLMTRISGVVSAPLYSVFRAHKALADGAGSSPFVPDARSDEHSRPVVSFYDSFVKEQGDEGMKGFFGLYPVAARLVAVVTISWIEFTLELLQRLDGDREQLCQHFNAQKSLGKVVGLRAGLSDPHHQGRCVVIIKFQSGTRLVYKPRSLKVDGLFADLVTRLNIGGFDPAWKAPKFLLRDGYGWMEFADHDDCDTRRAVSRFYRRAGGLACLVHFLGGVDCHRENLVAAGEHPILVDCEALGHPMRQGEEWKDEISPPGLLANSPLRTGLLPFWQIRPNQISAFDGTGLGAPIRQLSLVKSVRWESVANDDLRPKTVRNSCRHASHRPRLRGAAPKLEAFVADVVAGYLEAEHLLKGTGKTVFHELQSQIYASPRRWIKRPTAVYAIVLRRSLRTENLIEGIDRSLALEVLPPEGTDLEDRAVEFASLERLDVPYFSHSTTPKLGLSQSQIGVIRASLSRKLIVVDGLISPLSKWRKARSLASQKIRTGSRSENPCIPSPTG